ncbi:hypothetical protein Peur_069268 [Populus x canadensis]
MVLIISSNLVNFVYDRNLSIRQHSRLFVTCISFHYAVKVISLFVEDISISIIFLSFFFLFFLFYIQMEQSNFFSTSSSLVRGNSL